MLAKHQATDQLPSSTDSRITEPTTTDATSCKVSMIVGDLSAKGAGRWGSAVRPFLLTQALQQLGLQVEILGFSDDDTPLSTDTSATVKRFPKTTYPNFAKSAMQLVQAIEGNMIYAYKTKASSFGVGLLAKKLRRLPLALDVDDWEMSWHGGDQWRYQPSLKQRYRDFVQPNGALRQPDHPIYLKRMEARVNQADVVTVHTTFLQQKFGGVYIPNGKDIHNFDPDQHNGNAIRQRFGLGAYKILMFPGAPRPYKGLEDLLTALDILDRADVRLVIVGGSPYDDYDQTLQQRWGRHIIQLPKLPYAEMPQVVAAADMIVVPQRDTAAAKAQFPLKLTDGMAMAKPILATRVGDIPNIVGDAGYIVAAGDSDAMAQKITEILADPLGATARGHRARDRCIQHYSIEAMARALSEVVTPLLSSHASHK